MKRTPLFCTLILSGVCLLGQNPASAATLVATAGGTFNMNLDRDVLATSTGGSPANPGHFLVHYYDAAESDYTTRTDSSIYFNNPLRTEVPATNLLHELTPIAATNPPGQASGRYVKSTSPNFAIDSATLTATGVVGMTGIELYKGLYNGALIYGDYSLHYNPGYRQAVYDDFGLSKLPSGWYLQNNVSFSAAVYELAGLSLVVGDEQNWKLSGSLLISPENSGLLHIPLHAVAGDFCLGVGSYSGCGQIAAVPVPAAVWMLASGLAGLAGFGVRRRMVA